jgi:two-component system sensor histidine kinase/response regulator
VRAQPVAAATQPTDTAPMDLGPFNRLTAGDPEFAHDLAGTFAASGRQQLLEINRALEAADRGALARAAHKLKGASANLHAQALVDLTARLEVEAGAAQLTQLRQLGDAVQHEFNRTNDFLIGSLPPRGKTGSDA